MPSLLRLKFLLLPTPSQDASLPRRSSCVTTSPPALCALHVHSPLCSSCCPLLPTPPFSPSSPCAQPSLLQLLPSAAEPSGEEVFIADSLNGIQLSHIKKALADAGETCHTYHTSHHTPWARWQTQVGGASHIWRGRGPFNRTGAPNHPLIGTP